MRQNLERALTEIFGHEGGFTDDPRDRGNWTEGRVGKGQLKGTKFGISAMSYPRVDIRNLTREKAADIYRLDFWAAVEGDALPSGVDLCVFDAAVNSGSWRATRWLQEVVGVSQDGRIGPLTMGAVSARKPADIINAYCDARLRDMRTFATWDDHGKGWTRRVEGIRATALKWAAEGPVVTRPPQHTPEKRPNAVVAWWRGLKELFRRN